MSGLQRRCVGPQSPSHDPGHARLRGLARRLSPAGCRRWLRSLLLTTGLEQRFEPLLGRVLPWWRCPSVRTPDARVPTMLSTEEVKVLYRLAREEYSGQGTIVDCGPFLGGSTVALCAGLKDNPGRFPKAGRVHSYDRFRYESYFERWFRPVGRGTAEGASFAPLYRRLTGAYRDYLVVHEGDVVSATYEGGPIELLFLDICKSWEINAAVVGTFFTHLVPGRSLVVQQDYAHFYPYWLVVTMDFFADYFEPAGHVTDDGTSVVFRCVRSIPGPLLRTDLRGLPLSRKRYAFERVLPRFQGWQQAQLLIGYCRMLIDEGERSAAEEVARRIDPALYRHPLNREGMSFIVGWFDFLKDQAA